MKALWAVQKFAINDIDGGEMTDAIVSIGADHAVLTIPPFDYSNIVPPDHNGPVIPYGGTHFIEAIMGKPGWFCVFNDNFRYQVATAKLGSRMFNSDGEHMPLKCFDPVKFKDHEFIFARPDKDTKEFAGMVVKPMELFEWIMSARGMDHLENIDILVAPASRIDQEWRLYVVDSNIVSGSQYRVNHTYKVSADVPQNVLDYANEAIKLWQPAPFFVIDICRVGDSLSVLEIGDLHSAGWYASDKKATIKAVTEYALKNHGQTQR